MYTPQDASHQYQAAQSEAGDNEDEGEGSGGYGAA